MIKVRIWLISVIVIAMMVSAASALPEMLDAFNTKYNTKGTRLDTCATCHIYSKPQKPTCDEICHIPNNIPNNIRNKFQKEIPQKENSQSLNSYGMDLKSHLNIETPLALTAIETIDSDGSGFTNIDKIHNLTFPGDKNDFPNKNKKKGYSFGSILESLLSMFQK